MKSLAQLECVKIAAKRLGFSVVDFDSHGNLFDFSIDGRKLTFANFAVPWNSGSVEQICKDKEFTNLMLRGALSIPKAYGYFDPDFTRPGYESYKKFKNMGSIVADIVRHFSFPVVVKRNSGMRGINVFLCRSESEVETALRKIFAKDSPDYDYAALSQEYVKSKAEYRAILFRGRVVLLYLKDNSNAKFTGNISPLHFEGARATLVEDEKLHRRLEEFLAPIFLILPVEFGGFDIILDESGGWHLIEINTRPGFAYFIRDNGKEPIVRMYETILKSLI